MRKDTLYNWQRSNPILLDGEIGLIKDTTYAQVYNKMVIGDGIHSFEDLPFIRLDFCKSKYEHPGWTTTIISQECIIDTDNYFIF